MARVSALLSLLAVVALGSLASAQSAPPRVDTTLGPTSIRVGGAVLDVGCVVTGATRAGDRLVVSCTGGEIRSFAPDASGAFVLADARRAPAEVGALFAAEGVAWALVDGTALRVDSLPAIEPAPSPPRASEPAAPDHPTSPPVETTPLAAPRPDATAERARDEFGDAHDREGPPLDGATVLGLRGAHAVLPPGLPLENGHRVELVPAEGTRHAPVVGTVSSVTEDAIEVDIGFGETVRVGDRVRRTAGGTTARPLDPPEQRRTVSVGGHVGVLIDAAGIGAVADLELRWRSDLPFALRARVFPFTTLYVGHTTDVPEHGGALVGGGSVDAMLDTTYFAVGVGIGFGQYTTRLSRTPLDPSADQRVGFAVLPTLRAGPVDGLSLELTGNILAVVDEFRFGGLDGRVRIPVAPGFWIELRGGGWPSGLALAEGGLRIAAEGNGGPGTIFVTPMVGFAGIDTGNHGFRSGPIIGIAVEGRVGQ